MGGGAQELNLKDSMAVVCDEIERSEEQRFKEVRGILEQANNLVSGFHDERMTMAKSLLSKFARDRSELLRDNNDLLAVFANKRRQCQRDLAELREDLKEAFQIWQRFAKRSSDSPGTSRVRGVTKPSSNEAQDVRDKIMVALFTEDEGVTIDQLDAKVKISTSRLAKELRKLMKEGKVEKKGEKYFKIAG